MLDRVNRVVHMLVLSPLLFLMMSPALFVSGYSGSFLSSDLGFLQPPLLWIHSSTLFREKKVVCLFIKIDWNYPARYSIQPQ